MIPTRRFFWLNGKMERMKKHCIKPKTADISSMGGQVPWDHIPFRLVTMAGGKDQQLFR
jgi:hypothetical protein